MLASKLVDPVKSVGQTVVVLSSGAGGPPRTAAYHQALCIEGGGQLAGPTYLVQLVRQDIGIDESGSGVDADQFDAVVGK